MKSPKLAYAVALVLVQSSQAGGQRIPEPMAGHLTAAAYAIAKLANAEGIVLQKVSVRRSEVPVLANVVVEAEAPFWKLAALLGMADGSTTMSKTPTGRKVAFQVRLEDPTGPGPSDPAPHAPISDWVALTDVVGLTARCMRFNPTAEGAWQVAVEADAPADLAMGVCERARAKIGEARLTGIELLRPNTAGSRLVVVGYARSPNATAPRASRAAQVAESPSPDAPARPAPGPPGPAPAAWSGASSWLQGYVPADRLEITEDPSGALNIVR